MSDDKQSNSISLTKSEHTANFFQGMLIGIPHIGPSLEKIFFGGAQELRWKRLEQTLTEVAEALKERDATNGVEKEEFIEFIEKVGPSISRETAEEKRKWFRDLLRNVAMTPAGDPKMEEARIAAELIKQVNAPGLEILAKLNSPVYQHKSVIVSLDRRAAIAILQGESNVMADITPLSYDLGVVEIAIRQLKSHELITGSSPIVLRKAGYTTGHMTGYGEVQLTNLGRMFVRWGGDCTTGGGPQ